MVMNIKKIIREEVEDFDWIKDEPSYEEVLDNRFRLEPIGDGWKFVEVIEHHGYERSTYTSLLKHGPRALYKILMGVRPSWWNKSRSDSEILKTLQVWKLDRIKGLKKHYPDIKRVETGDTGPR
jgi:hypothetical protein